VIILKIIKSAFIDIKSKAFVIVVSKVIAI